MKVVDIRSTIPRHPTRQWRKRQKIKRIVVHCTASNNQDPDRTAHYHVTPGPWNRISKRGCPSIAYHDFITQQGTIYRCNDYTDWTWHAGLWNRTSIGVALAYRGQDGQIPCAAQFHALITHLVTLCLDKKILPSMVRGHREAPWMMVKLGRGSTRYKTVCPGMGIDLPALRATVTRYMQRRLLAEGLYTGKIDGIFGRLSRQALRARRTST